MPYKPTGRPRGRPRRDGTPAGSEREKPANSAARTADTTTNSGVVGITTNRINGQFAPGVSGNPSGRPRGYVSFARAYTTVSTLSPTELDALCDGGFPADWRFGKVIQYQVAARAYRKMLDEAPPSLLSEVADRSDGKVAQKIEQSVDVKGIIALPAPPPGVAWLDVIETHLAGTLPPAPDTDD